MSQGLITHSTLEDIADAIRAKLGVQTEYLPSEMAAAIRSIGGGGLELVPWSTGTDEQIVAMLEAAHNGDINLQTDGGWAVGDTRTISVGSYTTTNGVTIPATTMQIVITSFDEYMSSGNVLQFDFKTYFPANTQTAIRQRMNESDTNVGGYGASEMKTTTLPLLVGALPTWLRNSLIEFSVLASAGSQSSIIETVTGNKLALRSEIEVLGTTQYSFVGEGSQLSYYASSDSNKNKVNQCWMRSPHKNVTDRFLCAQSSTPNSALASRTDVCYIAPFGCL